VRPQSPVITDDSIYIYFQSPRMDVTAKWVMMIDPLTESRGGARPVYGPPGLRASSTWILNTYSEDPFPSSELRLDSGLVEARLIYVQVLKFIKL